MDPFIIIATTTIAVLVGYQEWRLRRMHAILIWILNHVHIVPTGSGEEEELKNTCKYLGIEFPREEK